MNRLASYLTSALLLSAAVASAQDKPKPGADKIDFQKQVLPILEKRCFECHSAAAVDPAGKPKKPKGGVSMDTKDGILASKKGKLLVAKKPAESKLIAAISLPADDEDRMPPPKKGDPLPKADVELLTKWVEQGADFGDWTGKKKTDKPKEGDKGKGDEKKPGEEKKPGDTKKPGDEKKHGEVPKSGEAAELAALAEGLDAADAAVLAELGRLHAKVAPVDHGSPLLTVSFFGHEDETTDATVAALAPAFEHIAELRLPRTRITDAAAASIAKMPRLRVLDLRETAVADAGVAALAKLPALVSLNLFGTKVGDAGIAALAACKPLRQVYVWQTGASANAVAALGTALPEARIVFAADLPEPMAAAPAGAGRRRGGK